MSTRSKRTYNLDAATVRRVRELSERYAVAGTQDAVVEVAIDRLYRDVLEADEAARWADARTDPAFQAEVEAIAADYEDAETSPR